MSGVSLNTVVFLSSVFTRDWNRVQDSVKGTDADFLFFIFFFEPVAQLDTVIDK